MVASKLGSSHNYKQSKRPNDEQSKGPTCIQMHVLSTIATRFLPRDGGPHAYSHRGRYLCVPAWHLHGHAREASVGSSVASASAANESSHSSCTVFKGGPGCRIRGVRGHCAACTARIKRGRFLDPGPSRPPESADVSTHTTPPRSLGSHTACGVEAARSHRPPDTKRCCLCVFE